MDAKNKETVLNFLNLLKDMDGYLEKFDSNTHHALVKLGNKHGFDFSRDDLKYTSRELFEGDDNELSAWLKLKMKDRYLAYWID